MDKDTESAVAVILERKKKRLEEQVSRARIDSLENDTFTKEKRMQEQANQDHLLQELASAEKSLEKSARTSRNFFSFAKR